jgi:Ser/Thr protein kinase RdoA (MazF antagonist)
LTDHIPSDPRSTSLPWLSKVTGCGIRSTEWIGIGFGLSGHCCRVIGQGGQGEEVDVVVKLTTEVNASREIAFYRHYAPDTPIATPAFYGGEVADGRGYLVVDTVVDAIQGDVLAGTTRKRAEAMAGALAHLHGRWWNDSALDRLRVLSPPKRSQPAVLTDDTVDRFLSRRGEGLGAEHRKLIATLGTRLPVIHEALWGGARTLIHTDAHLDNVLWSGDDPVFIDWEGAMVGPPEVDVARLLIEGMTPVQYGQFGSAALSTYQEALFRTGRAEGGIDDTRVAAAALRSLAGIVGWIGGAEVPPPGGRTRLLGDNALRAALAVHDSLAETTDL